MPEKEKYCPLTKICKYYEGCKLFYNEGWFGCTNFTRLRDYFMELIHKCLEDAEYDIKQLHNVSNVNTWLVKTILKNLPDNIKDNVQLQYRKDYSESLIIL